MPICSASGSMAVSWQAVFQCIQGQFGRWASQARIREARASYTLTTWQVYRQMEPAEAVEPVGLGRRAYLSTGSIRPVACGLIRATGVREECQRPTIMTLLPWAALIL